MTPWTLLDRSEVPGKGEELKLYQRGTEFSIRSGYRELMNSRMHGSEEALAELACARIAGRRSPTILIGGLGMGYTLAAALRSLRGPAEIIVAELVPAVVRWNRGPLAGIAGHPLRDKRVTVREGDVGELLRAQENVWDAIVLDVDNGPEGMTRQENDWLYGLEGVRSAFRALRPGGVLTVWSATPEAAFTKRLRKSGFEVEEVRVRARGSRGGARHMIWLATRPGR
jgi:spermidine synthase